MKQDSLVKNISFGCIFMLIIIGCGCTANRLAYDHRELREQVILLYEEQVMDNLIRAYNGDVVLHLNYSGFAGDSATDTEIGGQFGDDDNESIGVVGGGDPDIIALDKDGWVVNGKVKIHNKLSLAASPVNHESAGYVYGCYLDFVRHPNRYFEASSVKPEDGQAFKWRKRVQEADEVNSKSIMYYWVPNKEHARDAFYQLVLSTSHIQKDLDKQTPAAPASKTVTTKEIVTDTTTTTKAEETTGKTKTKETTVESTYTKQ